MISTIAAPTRRRWQAARRAEHAYATQLRRVARAIGDIIRGITPKGVLDEAATLSISDLLSRYSEILEPWAQRVARRMIEDVATRNFRAWMETSREIGVNLRREIEAAPTGQAMREALADQVRLITSLPTEAAERVHRLAIEARMSGRRAESIAKEILATADVSRSRAETIARTEIGRVDTELLKARSLSIGVEEYIWWTSLDADVRPGHRVLHGKRIRWDSPPVVDHRSGRRAHAGADYNDRCIALPILAPTMFMTSSSLVPVL